MRFSVCSTSVSFAVIKHPDRKQLSGERIYFSVQCGFSPSLWGCHSDRSMKLWSHHSHSGERGEMHACLRGCAWISSPTLLQPSVTCLGDGAACSGQDLPTSMNLRHVCPPQPSLDSSSLRLFPQETLGFVMLTTIITLLGNLGKVFINKIQLFPMNLNSVKNGFQSRNKLTLCV